MFSALHTLAARAALHLLIVAEGERLRITLQPKATGDAPPPPPLQLVATPAEFDAGFVDAVAAYQAPVVSLIEQAGAAVASVAEAATKAAEAKPTKAEKKAPAKKAASSIKATGTKYGKSLFVPHHPDAVLAAVVGPEPAPRTKITERLWTYIKAHGLRDKAKKRMINADDILRPLLDGRDSVPIHELAQIVTAHLTIEEEVDSTAIRAARRALDRARKMLQIARDKRQLAADRKAKADAKRAEKAAQQADREAQRAAARQRKAAAKAAPTDPAPGEVESARAACIADVRAYLALTAGAKPSRGAFLATMPPTGRRYERLFASFDELVAAAQQQELPIAETPAAPAADHVADAGKMIDGATTPDDNSQSASQTGEPVTLANMEAPPPQATEGLFSGEPQLDGDAAPASEINGAAAGAVASHQAAESPVDRSSLHPDGSVSSGSPTSHAAAPPPQDIDLPGTTTPEPAITADAPVAAAPSMQPAVVGVPIDVTPTTPEPPAHATNTIAAAPAPVFLNLI